jgi:hypothetical protein
MLNRKSRETDLVFLLSFSGGRVRISLSQMLNCLYWLICGPSHSFQNVKERVYWNSASKQATYFHVCMKLVFIATMKLEAT